VARRTPVDPDVAQEALIEFGELASRTGKFGSGHDGLDTDHDCTGQEASARAKDRTLDRVDMT